MATVEFSKYAGILSIKYAKVTYFSVAWIPKAQTNKVKRDKLDYTNVKLLSINDIINRVKRQPMEWKEIFANHISDNELKFRIYRKLLGFNTRNKNNLIQK